MNPWNEAGFWLSPPAFRMGRGTVDESSAVSKNETDRVGYEIWKSVLTTGFGGR